MVLAAAGLVLTVLLAHRLADDAWVRRIVIAAYVVKAAAAVALFFVSLWGLPILTGAQTGNGFWSFARDAAEYHRLALGVTDAWQTDGGVPPMGFEKPTVLYVAVVYRLFGEVPLNVGILNAWYGTLTALGAVWVAQRYGARALSVRATALLVGLWPSGVLWSTQVLKESITTAMMAGLVVFMAVATRTRRPQTAFIAVLSVAALVFLLWFSRYYAASAFVAALFTVVVPWAITQFFRGEGRRAGIAIGACLFVLAGLGLAAGVPMSERPESAGWSDFADATRHEEVTREPSESSRVSEARDTVSARVRTLPSFLGVLRDGGMAEPGRSVLDPDVTIASWGELLRYLPRGLAVEFLAPFPWQWFLPDAPASYLLAGFENVIIYALLPCVAVAAYRLFRRYDPVLTTAGLTIAMLAAGYAIVISSVGTLFRLRFQLIVLALVMMGSVDAFAVVYGRVFRARPRSTQVPAC